MSYWENRAEDILIENEKTVLEYEKELILEYERAIKNINREVRAFYAQYAEDNKIDLLEANQRLKKKELMSFKLAVKDYQQMIKQVGGDIFTDDYKEVLQDLLDRMHVSRLQELELNIQNEIEQLRVKQEKGLTEVLQETYKTSYDKINASLKLKAKQDVSFTSPGKKQLETAIKEKWLEDNYSGRIWKNKTKLVSEVKQLLQQEFVRGRSPEEVALDLSQKMGTNLNNTRRLIRTELNYISNKGTIQAYKDSEIIEQYQFLAHLDNRTSEICSDLDGKVFNLKDAKAGVNLPPLHPHCRSTTIPFFSESEEGIELEGT